MESLRPQATASIFTAIQVLNLLLLMGLVHQHIKQRILRRLSTLTPLNQVLAHLQHPTRFQLAIFPSRPVVQHPKQPPIPQIFIPTLTVNRVTPAQQADRRRQTLALIHIPFLTMSLLVSIHMSIHPQTLAPRHRRLGSSLTLLQTLCCRPGSKNSLLRSRVLRWSVKSGIIDMVLIGQIGRGSF